MNRALEAVPNAGGLRATSYGRGLSLFKSAGIVLAGSALIAVCAHLSIPLWFTPVPLTLQPFAVMLLGLLLSPRLAFWTMVTYLAEGAVDLPVFTPYGLGGIAQLLGPTGGYLLSYPLAGVVVSFAYRGASGYGGARRTFSRGLVAAGAGSMVTLASGAVWLGVWTHAAVGTVFNHAVLPFLPGDLLKVAAAAGIAAGVKSWRRVS